MNIWLFGYEFPQTIMVFGEKQIHFLCSQMKASLLEAVTKTVQDVVGADIVMHVKSKGEDGSTQMDAIFNLIRTQLKSPVVGYIAKEAPEGKLLEMWADKLKNSGLPRGDITHGISDILALKDRMEIMNVRKAAYLSASTLKYCVVPKLVRIIDEEKRATHSSLSKMTEKAVLEGKGVRFIYLPVCQNGGKKATHSSFSDEREQSLLRLEKIDICYAPIFQSGGKFDLRPGAISNDETLLAVLLYVLLGPDTLKCC
ncbi:unnamed protein product [Cuscuta campestris]|uniref:FACT complex subunit n=1 Tax=Cuscuta campestris TaxID=132261 RepID=A0A484LD10_9ASTE|nr:unnamed protein product [Cuscuta campestris]